MTPPPATTGRRVTVVGAGVIGLTCAVRLAEAGYTVDVMARELPLETTSAVAGGLWLPFLAEPVADVARWSARSLRAFTELAEGAGPDAGPLGIAVREGYLLGVGPERPDWALTMTGLLDLVAVTDPAPGHPQGWHLRVPLVDTTVYLPYLVRRLEAAGGTLTRLPLTALPARGLVVNCTGLAARALAADPSVHPVRGQVAWLSNPGGLSTWYSDERDPLTYVIPHPTHIVVGGTARDGDYDTDVDPATAEVIVARARALVPSLTSSEVIGHRVGLRPARPTVRLETVTGAEGTTIHCYGHGGCGVTVSWGCADDVLAAAEALVPA
jgi:D-amino-acid oxidase